VVKEGILYLSATPDLRSGFATARSVPSFADKTVWIKGGGEQSLWI
jgi:hypothetical protein